MTSIKAKNFVDSDMIRQKYLNELSEKNNVSKDIVDYFADYIFLAQEDNNQLPKIIEFLGKLNSDFIKNSEPVSINELLNII